MVLVSLKLIQGQCMGWWSVPSTLIIFFVSCDSRISWNPVQSQFISVWQYSQFFPSKHRHLWDVLGCFKNLSHVKKTYKQFLRMLKILFLFICNICVIERYLSDVHKIWTSRYICSHVKKNNQMKVVEYSFLGAFDIRVSVLLWDILSTMFFKRF